VNDFRQIPDGFTGVAGLQRPGQISGFGKDQMRFNIRFAQEFEQTHAEVDTRRSADSNNQPPLRSHD
jgi:hypothetical protein